MVEWSITPVLKTGAPRGAGGSNPSLSAIKQKEVTEMASFFVWVHGGPHATNA